MLSEGKLGVVCIGEAGLHHLLQSLTQRDNLFSIALALAGMIPELFYRSLSQRTKLPPAKQPLTFGHIVLRP